ncbi:voltage-dependent anion channel [Panaeolus papilionaceus]|nr:voltage-dependent anion channel [Panaeolus papilionaceus]
MSNRSLALTSPTPTLTSDSLPRPRAVHPLARRVHGWSWQGFPIGMGTGAVYLTLSGIKDHSPLLVHVETVFFFINLAIFFLNCTTLFLQAILYPKQAWRLLTHPVKSIFVPLIVLSFATLLIGTINYAVPHELISAESIYALFWVYVTFSIITCFFMLMVWFNKPHDLTEFSPAYAFLIFPMMLVGIVAFNVLRVMDHEDHRSLGVLLTGYFFQGLGFFMTFFYICIYIIRLIMTGFLEGHQANGAFVACGPPGFTALALIRLGEHASRILPEYGLVSPLAGEIWYAGSVLGALLLFGLAVFFFIFGALPYYWKVHKSLNEILGCWALTFPNVGWIATLRLLGDIFQIRGFYYVHVMLAVCMCITWAILFILTIVAFFKGLIFNTTNDEDVLQDESALARAKSYVTEKSAV